MITDDAMNDVGTRKHVHPPILPPSSLNTQSCIKGPLTLQLRPTNHTFLNLNPPPPPKPHISCAATFPLSNIKVHMHTSLQCGERVLFCMYRLVGVHFEATYLKY